MEPRTWPQDLDPTVPGARQTVLDMRMVEAMVEMVKSYNRNPNNNDGKMDGKSCFLREKLIEKTKKCQKKDGNDGKHVFPYGKID